MLEHTVRQVWGKLVQVWVDGVYQLSNTQLCRYTYTL